MHCSESMYEEVQKLADMLDEGSKNSTRTIRVVPLSGVDPLLVQQAINAIQGRRTTTTQPGANPSIPNGGGRGGNMTPGFTPGGFNPGSSPRTTPAPGGTTPTYAPGGGAGQPGGGRSYSTPRSGQQSRGPDFFGSPVKDDPESPILFDPQHPTQLTSAANQPDASARDGSIAPPSGAEPKNNSRRRPQLQLSPISAGRAPP